MRGLKIFSVIVTLAILSCSCASGHERCPAYGGFNIEQQEHENSIQVDEELNEEEKA
ncbi:MAG: hypothetical protein JKY54_16085 [Flavobacteriales bacterium]|nr:hypothetical protein [Flavobacteriales bacterium]